MKCHIPQISWHNRDPVLSIDCQATEKSLLRIATAGTDTHVLIWVLHLPSKGTLEVEFVADLNRHTRTVNVVRFSPNGELLASGDDEASIILWKMQARDERDIFLDDDGNKEHWAPLKILRGHIDDVCDICWSKDSLLLISGSVDNTALLWDVQKGKNVGIINDHKGFVQGVAWDPAGQYYATLSSDRTMRIYSQQTKKLLHKVQKAVIPGTKETSEGTPKSSKIFYDDTMKTFCRRLSFSPDGEILVVPSGIIEQEDGKFINASYVFSRHALNRPVVCLPTNDKFTVAVRCCPVLFTLKQDAGCVQTNPESEIKSAIDLNFNLPYRIVFAVATQNAILVYDTQHSLPIAHISNIHYTRLTDLAWSSDGKILMASSTDGYCSFIIFGEGELGENYKEKLSSSLEAIQDKESKTEKSLQGAGSVEKANSSDAQNLNRDDKQNKRDDDIKLIKTQTSVSQETLPMETVNNTATDEAVVIDHEESARSLSTDRHSSSSSNCEPMDISDCTATESGLTSPSSDVKKMHNSQQVKPGRRIQLVTLTKN